MMELVPPEGAQEYMSDAVFWRVSHGETLHTMLMLNTAKGSACQVNSVRGMVRIWYRRLGNYVQYIRRLLRA